MTLAGTEQRPLYLTTAELAAGEAAAAAAAAFGTAEGGGGGGGGAGSFTHQQGFTGKSSDERAALLKTMQVTKRSFSTFIYI